jgi:hypothetical protein
VPAALWQFRPGPAQQLQLEIVFMPYPAWERAAGYTPQRYDEVIRRRRPR